MLFRSHYWLRNTALAPAPELAKDIIGTLASVEQFAAEVHAATVTGVGGPFRRVLVVGIGGSALGPQFVAHALGRPDADRMTVHFFDNTDPDGMDKVLAAIGGDLDRTLTVVISKSGGTKETRNGLLEAKAAYERAGLRFEPHAKHGFLYRVLEGAFNALAKVYDVTLRGALRFHYVTFVIALATLGGTVYLFLTMPTGFIPSQDSGYIFGPTQAGQDISFESMAKHARAVADVALADPNTESIFTNVGDSNTGILFIPLKPRKDRQLDVDHAIAQLRPKIGRIPGIMAFLQNPPPISVSGQNNNSSYQMVVHSTSLQDIYTWAPRLMDAMRGIQGDRKSTRLNSSHIPLSRMPSSA